MKTGPAHTPQRSSLRVCPASRPGRMVFGMAEEYRNPVSADSRYETPDQSSRRYARSSWSISLVPEPRPIDHSVLAACGSPMLRSSG